MSEYVIGDVNSSARGSGARFNAGKAPLELIPLNILALTIFENGDDNSSRITNALIELGYFQINSRKSRSGSKERLVKALNHIGNPMEECAKVFDYGRRKYAEWNWLKGMPWSVPLGCAARHLLAMSKGQLLDDESGLPHAGHVACNIVMLISYIDCYQEGNDLPQLADS